MSSTNRMYFFIKNLSTKSLTIIFSNSVMIIFRRTRHKPDPIDTPSIVLKILLLKLCCFTARSMISFFIVRFRNVVRITLSSYKRFKTILMVLFKGTLENSDVTSTLINLYPSSNSSLSIAWILLAASKESFTINSFSVRRNKLAIP